jgi:hypothetical protein
MGEATLEKARGVPRDAIKEAVGSLPDVQSCKLEFDQEGSISAIHVVSTSKRAAKQIVRDIESVLQAQFSISIDHRKISVARLSDKSSPKAAKITRPRLVSINISITGGTGRCCVVLDRDGYEAVGEVAGVVAGGGSLRLIANATFRALEGLVGQEISLDLLDVVRLQASDRSVVMVLANYVSADDVRSLAGCVQFQDSEQTAVVHASLDACNRIIESLPPVERTEYEVTPFEES